MYRVLLVDDEILVREAISENINWEALGYELAGSCQNGKEAIEFLEKNFVDVVLTDICMPFVDGMKLSEFIFHNYPETNIIIFSGFDDFEYAKKAIKYNVKEYLLKPVTAAEISDILASLKETMDEKKEIETKLDRIKEAYNKNKILIKSKLLTDFIMGSKTEEENAKALMEADVKLDAFRYCVAVIEIDLYSDLHVIEKAIKQQSYLMAFAVYNISDEIVRQYQAGVVCQGNMNRTFILFMDSGTREFEEKIRKVCQEIKEQVAEYMKLMITIGIGRGVKSKKEIYHSYEEADQSFRYRYLFGEGSLIDMKEISGNEAGDIRIDDKLDSLMIGVKSNDKELVERIFEQIQQAMIQAVEDKGRSSLYLQRIVLAVAEMLKTVNMERSQSYVERDQVLSDISVARTLKEAIDILKKYCCQVAKELDLQKNAGGKKYVILALDYIKKNYADQELNLNGICSYLSISASRFSSIFKATTGETFMEVLIRTRMQKAKELLENTNLKNYEIAEKVGFSDPHYFSISFKKITGKTPTEYAKEKR